MKEEITYRVVLDYACFAIIVKDDKIIEAAPIAKWATGRTLYSFRKWVFQKGGHIHVVGK